MKIVFISNYFNHHQKPFCEEIYRSSGSDFKFISTTVMREERRKLGYGQEKTPDYVLLEYESVQKHEEAVRLVNEADVVIAGSASDKLLKERIRSGKLIFRYSERPFRENVSLLRRLYHSVNFRRKNMWKSKNIYMLCAGAFTSGDYASIGLYKNRTYKWGYFPEVKEYDTEKLFSEKKNNTLLWCGRFLDLKHPDDVIKAAHKLKSEGYDFRLNFVGNGIMEDGLKALTEELGLTEYVNFLGAMPPEKVRNYMEEAGIYLFTSDRKEGWGAVLNEAMNSGCAVVASNAVGSVSYLIEDGENGLIYESENVEMLYEKIKFLLEDTHEQRRLGKSAYETVINEWNAVTAAQRLLTLSEALLKNKRDTDLFEKGPCSKA